MAKVFLINPPSHTLGASNKRLTRVLFPPPPGGLAMVGGALLASGHEVCAKDMVIEAGTLETLPEEIQSYGADVVGLSVLGPAFEATQQICRAIKDAAPHVKIFAGNALPSEYPAWFLKEIPECDAVVVGEAEVSTPALLGSDWKSPIPGVMFRDQAPDTFQPRAPTESLDSLPFPAWELFPYHRYRASPQLLMRSKPTLGVLHTRGCPWQCCFCAQNFLWPNVRSRSMEHLVSEIRRNVLDLNVNHFGFYDSIFPLKKDSGRLLHEELVRQKLDGKIQFFCETRADLIWQDTFEWLKKCGLHLVFLGIETPKVELLQQEDKISKMYDPGVAIDTLRSADLRTYGLFIIGFPGETPEDRELLKNYALSLPLDVASFSIYTLYAGSPAARDQPDLDPAMLTQGNWALDGELAEAQQDLMRAFYLRPSMIARHLWRREISLERLIQGGWLLLKR